MRQRRDSDWGGLTLGDLSLAAWPLPPHTSLPPQSQVLVGAGWWGLVRSRKARDRHPHSHGRLGDDVPTGVAGHRLATGKRAWA